MKAKELTATHSNGTKIIERILESGTRFIKNIPFSPAVLPQLKQQFKNKSVEVELGNNGWIRIKKVGENKQLKEAARKIHGDKPVSIDDMMEMESKMLKTAGFTVVVKDIEI